MLKSKQRKEDKLRPYRVDYFVHDEMLKDRALVRSNIVRTTTAKDAVALLAGTIHRSVDQFTVIRTYRFYKKISAEPKKKVYIPVDKLLSAKKAVAVMTAIENRKPQIVIRPEDLKIESNRAAAEQTPAPKFNLTTDEFDSSKFVKVGDPQPATVFIPEWASTSGPAIEPCKWHGAKYVDGNNRCIALDSGSEYLSDLYSNRDTSNVSAGQPSPYTFPDQPVVPTEPAVFDDAELLHQTRGYAASPAAQAFDEGDRSAADAAIDEIMAFDPSCSTAPVENYDDGSENYVPTVEDVRATNAEPLMSSETKGWLTLAGVCAVVSFLVYIYFHFAK